MNAKSNTFEFSFLTLNTMGAPLKPRIKERYQKIATEIQNANAEFFALQEVFHVQKTRDWIFTPLAQNSLSMTHAHKYNLWKLKSTGSGLASLSRHPVVKEEFYSYKSSSSVDRLSNKGVLLTRILCNSNFEIDFYNTHLQASYLYRHQNAKTRIRQLHELSEFVHTHSTPKNLVIILGDFNFKENTPEYRCFMNDLWSVKGFSFLEIMRNLHPNPADKPLFTYQHLVRKSLKEKIDHKFMHVPKEWQWDLQNSSTQILDWDVSDHAPVLTRLCFAHAT